MKHVLIVAAIMAICVCTISAQTRGTPIGRKGKAKLNELPSLQPRASVAGGDMSAGTINGLGGGRSRLNPAGGRYGGLLVGAFRGMDPKFAETAYADSDFLNPGIGYGPGLGLGFNRFNREKYFKFFKPSPLAVAV